MKHTNESTDVLGICREQLLMVCSFARYTYNVMLDRELHTPFEDHLFLQYQHERIAELRDALAIAGKELWNDSQYYLTPTRRGIGVTEACLSFTPEQDMLTNENLQILVSAASQAHHNVRVLLDDFDHYRSLKVYRETAAEFFQDL